MLVLKPEKKFLPRVLTKRTLCNRMKVILTDTFISHTALCFIRLLPIVIRLFAIVALNVVQGHRARKIPLGKGMGGGLLFKDITLCSFDLILNEF